MIKLLKIEFNKVKSYKAFWICIILYSVLLPLLFTSVRSIDLKSDLRETALSMVYNFPNLWHNITYFAGWFNILLYLIMILLITNEFIFKTARQNVIDGLSKAQFVFSKLLLGVVLSLFTTLLVTVVGLISGYSFSEIAPTSQMIMEKSSFVLAYFVQTVGYMTFAIFIAFLFKRQGFSIIFFLIYSLAVENIVSLKLPELVGRYLPLTSFSGLIKSPFSKLITGVSQEAPELKFFIASIIYIFVFSGLSYLVLKNNDI
ncbi:MAG: ABC transporter permease [Candidatus Sericytochromatia bacterium]|nr:ABC transporter permease [Candidatus Sericytochromatia bacterium]